MEKLSKTETSRRDFLGLGAVAAGGLVLGLQGLAKADDAAKAGPEGAGDDVVLKLKEHGELGKVGGFEILDTPNGRVIVACVEAGSYAACSAICTHKGCEVGYEADSKEFVCPCHGARYGLDGKVKKGPAKRDLQPYNTDSAAVVSLKI